MQVMTVDLAYCHHAYRYSSQFHTPQDYDDVTGFIANMRGMCLGLKALKVTAMSRRVSLDVAQMPWQHLAVACRVLTLTNAAACPNHDINSDSSSCSVPASLHFLCAAAPDQTVSCEQQKTVLIASG